MNLEDVILRGTRASQPLVSAVGEGTLYCVTDEGDIIERSSGVAWESYSPTPTSGISELTGDVTAGPGSGSQATTLVNTAVTPGTYGDATNSPRITVDAKGRITNVVDTPISGGGGGGDVSVVNTTVTSAMLNNINSAPITLVAASPNKVIVPMRMAVLVSRDAPFLSTSPTISVRWNGDTNNLLAGTSFFLSGGGAGIAYRDFVKLTEISPGFGGFDPRNKALILFGDSDSTGGNANLYLKISLSYFLASF